MCTNLLMTRFIDMLRININNNNNHNIIDELFLYINIKYIKILPNGIWC